MGRELRTTRLETSQGRQIAASHPLTEGSPWPPVVDLLEREWVAIRCPKRQPKTGITYIIPSLIRLLSKVQRLINVFQTYEIFFSKRKLMKFSSEDIEKWW